MAGLILELVKKMAADMGEVIVRLVLRYAGLLMLMMERAEEPGNKSTGFVENASMGITLELSQGFTA